MTSVVLALAPSVLLVLWLRRLGMLQDGGRAAKALLAGAAAVARSVAVGEAASIALARVVPAGTAPHHVLRYVICVALVEEASKRRAVIRATRGGGGAFVLVGIGFGAAEDALYVATGTGWVPRALTCASGHPLYGAVRGPSLLSTRQDTGTVPFAHGQDNGVRPSCPRRGKGTGARRRRGFDGGDARARKSPRFPETRARAARTKSVTKEDAPAGRKAGAHREERT